LNSGSNVRQRCRYLHAYVLWLGVSRAYFRTMTNKELENLKLHVAGATVRHVSPFDSLLVFKNTIDLDQDFINKFVNPFYMNIPVTAQDKKLIKELGEIKGEFTREVVQKLLGDFNWRTRQTGAYFAAINDFTEFEDTIGTLLLKSEVTYAGTMYALVLATFNTNRGREFLTTYLDYYLTKLDLFFDQKQVLTAVKYLDELNGTSRFEDYTVKWDNFLTNKPYWKRDVNTDALRKDISGIDTVQKYAC
jgi:hypothetical protein